MYKSWIILLISCSLILDRNRAHAREVTNEDIRDAMLSLVHMVRAGEDKLERHEYRERQLGEQLKKALAGLEKRHRTLEPVKGTLGRLDERLANVETILIQKDERERIQLQKTNNAIEDIRNALQVGLQAMETLIRENNTPKLPSEPQPPPVSKEEYLQIVHQQKVLSNKVDSLLSNIQNLETAIVKVHEQNGKIERLNEKSVKNLDQVEGKLKNNEQLLEKYENSLAELNNKIPGILPQKEENNDWQNIFLRALENQRIHLEKLSSEIDSVDNKLKQPPAALPIEDLNINHNATLEKLEELRYEISAKAEKTSSIIDSRLKETEEKLLQNQHELLRSMTDMGEMSENVHADVAKSYDQLRSEVQALGKMEKVMIQTADNVMDTKRRIEYGVHQILLEVGDLIKIHSKDLNSTLNLRFDNIESTILDNQTGALANLSSKIEQEMSQVWRQIGIMYQELTASTTALDRLQEQTETYVNGSLSTMDSMEGKVGQITKRLGDMDENLNYFLGRLSLVTQEFNNIKSGLGSALDNIRSSFQIVQEKIKDSGPGPHNIDPEK